MSAVSLLEARRGDDGGDVATRIFEYMVTWMAIWLYVRINDEYILVYGLIGIWQ